MLNRIKLVASKIARRCPLGPNPIPVSSHRLNSPNSVDVLSLCGTLFSLVVQNQDRFDSTKDEELKVMIGRGVPAARRSIRGMVRKDPECARVCALAWKVMEVIVIDAQGISGVALFD